MLNIPLSASDLNAFFIRYSLQSAGSRFVSSLFDKSPSWRTQERIFLSVTSRSGYEPGRSTSHIVRTVLSIEVSITGVVEKVSKSSSSNTYFLTINDGTGQIPAIAFESVVIELENSQTPIDIFKNEKVIITGTITEYNSKLELIISDGSSIKLAN